MKGGQGASRLPEPHPKPLRFDHLDVRAYGEERPERVVDGLDRDDRADPLGLRNSPRSSPLLAIVTMVLSAESL